MIIACRVVETGTVAGFIWLWLPVVIVSSRKYFYWQSDLFVLCVLKRKEILKLFAWFLECREIEESRLQEQEKHYFWDCERNKIYHCYFI